MRRPLFTKGLCWWSVGISAARLAGARRHGSGKRAGAEAAGPHVMSASIDTGAAVELHPDNVTHLNSRQVRFACCFVYSANDRFELIRSMIDDKPEYRAGMSIRVD